MYTIYGTVVTSIVVLPALVFSYGAYCYTIVGIAWLLYGVLLATIFDSSVMMSFGGVSLVYMTGSFPTKCVAQNKFFVQSIGQSVSSYLFH
jgi:hypothetical protein